MSRSRTTPLEREQRAKLRTVEQVQNEIRRLYRLFANSKITAVVLKNRVATLTALRAGMADPVETPADVYTHPGFTILAVPADCFLSAEQIERNARGLSIVDINRCTPLQLEETVDSVVKFPRLTRDPPPEESPVEEFDSMTIGEMKRLFMTKLPANVYDHMTFAELQRQIDSGVDLS